MDVVCEGDQLGLGVCDRGGFERRVEGEGEQQGAQGVAAADADCRREGGRPSGAPLRNTRDASPYAQRMKGMREGALAATASTRAWRENVLSALVQSSERTILPGSAWRAACSAWQTRWAPPGMPTPSWRGARAGPRPGWVLKAQMAPGRAQTSPIAMGLMPPAAFCRARPLLSSKDWRGSLPESISCRNRRVSVESGGSGRGGFDVLVCPC